MRYRRIAGLPGEGIAAKIRKIRRKDPDPLPFLRFLRIFAAISYSGLSSLEPDSGGKMGFLVILQEALISAT